MTPIDTLVEWFNGLPSEMQEDAASIVFQTVPHELKPDLAREEQASQFAEQVQRWGEGEPRHRVGVVLMVASVIDLLMLKAERGWAETKIFMEDLLASDKSPGLNRLAQSTLERLPDREAMWLAAAARWRRLRESELALSSLQDWMRKQPIEIGGRLFELRPLPAWRYDHMA